MDDTRVHSLLRRSPAWDGFTRALHARAADRLPAARAAAEQYGSVYQGRRAAMVFDVIASRQRRYTSRVLPLVRRFEGTPEAASLARSRRQGPSGTSASAEARRKRWHEWLMGWIAFDENATSTTMPLCTCGQWRSSRSSMPLASTPMLVP